jgi:FG-GAP-like repeat
MRSAIGLIGLPAVLLIPALCLAVPPVSFNSPAVFTAGNKPSSVVTGDFNRDGNLDLAVANIGGNNITIRLGNGKGGFAYEAAYTVGAGPASIIAGDFNGDGKLDLAVAIEGIYPNWSSTVAVLQGNGDALSVRR